VIASEYTSSPVEQPATQTRVKGYVRSSGTIFSRNARKKVGSLNMAVTLTERSTSSRSIASGSCSTRSSSALIVGSRSAFTRRHTRRRSDACAYCGSAWVLTKNP
jgi:hypothetical protein